MENNPNIKLYSGRMLPMKELLAQRTIILEGADALSSKGFTQVPNMVLESKKISPGAKLTYAMLLKYAWQNDYCFPGQERLAEDMGVGKRSVVTYIRELEDQKFIGVKGQGGGKSNIDTLRLKVDKA